MAGLLFGSEAITTPRLALRAASLSDAEGLRWLTDALAPEFTLPQLQGHIEKGEAALITRAGGRPIGLAVALAGNPSPRAASLPFIAIDPAERFRGLGGEAGLALERQAVARWGVRRVYAPVPEGRGLGVYFWLRLGYAPLLGSESPGSVAGLAGKPFAGIWMARTV